MILELNREEEILRAEIISFSESYLNEDVVGRDRDQSFDRVLWKKCGDHLLQGLVIDKDCGGRGFSIRSTMIALEALGYGCRDNGLSFAIGAHLLACVVPIWLYGNKEQKNTLLPSLCNGNMIAANAISEAQSGSDAFNMNTIAKKVEDGYVLNGSKTYCSNAPVSDIIIAYAMTNKEKGMLGGISSFILKRDKHQFVTTNKIDKMGLRSCLMGDVIFNDLLLSENDLLGKEGGGAVIFSKSMIWERIGLSAIHLGTLSRIFETCIGFVKSRKSFGQSLSKYQAISHKLVDIGIEIEAIRLLLAKAISTFESKRSADLFASILKLKTSELYKNATLTMIQIYGAKGYINNSEIERMHRDSIASTLYSGSSEIQKNLIARKIGL